MTQITMEDLKRIYPDAESEHGGFYPSSYGRLDEWMGEVLVEVSDSDYQGTTRTLLRSRENANLYALHEYSWGSCSGCDLLQACDSWEQLLSYAQRHTDAAWQTSAQVLKWCDEQAKEIADDEFCWDKDERFKFVAAVRDALGPAPDGGPRA